jgi:triosephosphate isomerase
MEKILAFNWKLNPSSKKEAKDLALLSDKKGVIIFAPFVFLDYLNSFLKEASLGAQNVFWEKKGAFTGEISPLMLKNLGVRYVLLGHSERRKYFMENALILRKKIKASLEAKITPFFCVGEDKNIKLKGMKFVKKHIKNDILNSFQNIPKDKKIVLAYEPIWAIGGKKSDDIKRTEEIVLFIKKILSHNNFKNFQVVYGGSVNSKNFKLFLESNIVDGVLVGSRSVKKSEVKKFLNF